MRRRQRGKLNTVRAPGIRLEAQPVVSGCIACSDQAAADCEDLARAFADQIARPGQISARAALLERVNRIDDWVVCDRCQPSLSGEDKIRLMSLWVVLEGLRNWLRTEMRMSLSGALPTAPPIQLA